MAIESVHPEIKLEDTTPVQVSMQPFASNIVQEYEPEDKLVMSSEEDEKPWIQSVVDWHVLSLLYLN